MTSLFRLLLMLCPPSFRQRYGVDVLAMIEEERRSPPGGSSVIWMIRVVGDLIATAARQRLRQVAVAIRHPTGTGAPGLPKPPRRTEMDTLWQDTRYAWRQFTRRPGFTAIAILSLALGIGGNSLIYGLIDGLVLHPFPYHDPDRLVAIGLGFPKLSTGTNYVETMSPAEYADFRGSRSFSHTAAFDLGNRNISGGDVPERVFTALLLDDPFPVLGMPPVLGRGFTHDELNPSSPEDSGRGNAAPPLRVAIISYRLWKNRFGGDPSILTRTIRIGGQASSIVGVMPPGLVLIGTDLWIPWGDDPAQVPRNVRQFTAIARLAPGVTRANANAELAVIARRVEADHRASLKEYEGWQLSATPWAEALLRDQRPAAFMLLGAVMLVLLIACANLTNLFLARSTTRQRELAVRLALGAARWRLARQLLTESLMLTIAGAAAGLFLAYLGLEVSSVVIPPGFAMLDLHADLNVRVLCWTFVTAIAAGVLVAFLPALQATRTDPHDSLKSDARTGAGRAGHRIRQGLVVAEIALSVVLLLGAGLFLRSFMNVQRINLGFDPKEVLTMRLTLPRDRYAGDAVGVFFDRLVERVGALPGVGAVSAASQFPPAGTFDTQFNVEGAPDAGATLPTALITVATPTYFDALRVSLRGGRMYSAADRIDTPRVVVVNQAFASRFLPGRDAVGRSVRLGGPPQQGPPATIIGVVSDFRNDGATRPTRPEIYMPVRQQTAWNQLFLLVRADQEAANLIPSVRTAVASLDPEQPVYAVRTLEDVLAGSNFQQTSSAVLLGVFAGMALLLAAIGIYGVMSYTVSARTQEIGVRLALGSPRGAVMWLVVGQVLRLSALGLAIGLGLLLVLGRLLAQLLFGVGPADILTIVVATATLGVIAIGAAWAPAFRASRVDPMRALRYE